MSKDDQSSKKAAIRPLFKDRTRVLLLCSRGSLARTRHLMNDLKQMMPHAHSEAKFGKGEKLDELNEMCELANCTRCLYLESRKGRDVYLWAADTVDGGPSVKFLVRNIHTMGELNFSGNCLKGSRPLLSFDPGFDDEPYLRLIKEILISIFKTPNHHPRSQPFIDHVFNFALTSDGNIWFRNYQIVNEKCDLQEIGPRFALEVIRIFDGSFRGAVLYANPSYVTPNAVRRQLKLEQAGKHRHRLEQKEIGKFKDEFVQSVKLEDPVGEVFETKPSIEECLVANEQGKKEKKKLASSKMIAKKLDKMIVGNSRKRKDLLRREKKVAKKRKLAPTSEELSNVD